MTLVILTGASGSGKTAIAEAIERARPSIQVFRFDTIGIPSREVIDSFGPGHQPGGAWQRAMTLRWMERVAPVVAAGKHVLFEGQMRVAFLHEALAASGLGAAQILCVECDDATRAHRLTHERRQPELATESMMSWSRYLHCETVTTGGTILDTTGQTLEDSVRRVLACFEAFPI